MKPEELNLRIYGDPVLRQRAREVEAFDPLLAKQADKMFEVMYEHDGVGLAGNQVGLLQRLIVLDVTVDDDKRIRLALCNPKILGKSGQDTGEEGCLSIPDIRADVTRALTLQVEAQNLQGEKLAFEASGLLARAIQHEIDHLDGILFVDRISATRRKLLEGRLRALAQERAS